jgi:arylsulfatase
MERRNFIKSSLGIGLGATLPGMTHSKSGKEAETAVSPAMPVKSGKPHIILIMTDQQRGDALGCMGNKAVISPNIDRLAQEGSLFVSGYSSAPSSTPGRAGLLTGMSPWHHGMLGYGRMALKYRYEMPQMMRNLGYYTFGIGKMHWFPQKALHGFHATLIDESGRVESPDFISDYREWFQLQAPGKDPDLTGIGWNDHAAGVYKLDERLHPTAWTGQTACELIRNYDNDKPLFLKVSFARPHSPYDPPQRYLDMYKDADIPKPHIGDWCGQYAEPKDPLQGASDAPFGNFGDAYAINSRRHYYANITFIDDQVGQIIQTLKDKGMYDNTLICFTADHGDMLGDHYHWRKTYPYEGSAHIPYIVKWPAGISKSIPDGSSIEQPVELRDFLPTFIDIAGGSVPPDMDGRSLLKLIQGQQEQWRPYIDMEHATCYSDDNYWAALTDGKIKYIWNFHNGSEQLFDLREDPGETHNLSEDAAYQNKLSELRKMMVEHLSERGDSFVKDGKLMTLDTTLLYSPNFPK